MAATNCETVPERWLVVAEHRRGHGTGHLRRCAALCRETSKSPDWLLPEETSREFYDRSEVFNLTPELKNLPVSWVDTPRGEYDRIIVDRREMSRSELERLPSRGIIVAIDAGGDLRRYASYLVDTLTPPPDEPAANIADHRYLPFPRTVREDWPERCGTVLVAFGGEGNTGKTRSIADTLAGTGCTVDAVISGVSERDAAEEVRRGAGDKVQYIERSPALSERLARYDLVITHYGMLAWEALWARVPVILVNPSAYHDALALQEGFVTVSRAEVLRETIGNFLNIRDRCRAIRPDQSRSIAELVRNLEIPRRLNAPSGGVRYQPVVARFPDRTYFRNEKDGLVYLQNFRPLPITYDHGYFNEDYLKQYGRTYLQDFYAIARTGETRIDRILSLKEKRPGGKRQEENTDPVLLDIGCAYGPFLHAAAGRGCRVRGLEINEEAVRYVREDLGFDAIQGDLNRLSLQEFRESFDIITMWYVIEHVVDLDKLLHTCRSLLKPGGILAFSTPHGRGVSARTDPKNFLWNSPLDHFTVWDRGSAEKVLEDKGFRVRSFRITGHHPERFPRGNVLLLRPLLNVVSRILRLGDTFEVYAERL